MAPPNSVCAPFPSADVKNKYAQFMTALILQSYSDPQQSQLLPSLLSLIRSDSESGASAASSSNSPAPLNLCTSDLILRVLHDLSVTLGSDVTLRSIRSKDRLQRDVAIRDEIRANHAAGLAEAVWGIVKEGTEKLAGNLNASSTTVWTRSQAAEMTEMAINIVGDYVSWIDISLMITPQTVPLFFTLIQQEDCIGVRKATADALSEVISKGMKSEGKLELLRVLDLTTTVAALESTTSKKNTLGPDVDEDSFVELREKLARLANGIALELVKIVDEASAEESVRAAAEKMLLAHMPLVLTFLADDYDEPAECVLSGINATLNFFKKIKRKQAEGQTLPAGVLEVLSTLTDVTLRKLKYDDDAEWNAYDDNQADGAISDEDEARFIELRKQLQVLLTSVAAIEESIFSRRTEDLIFALLTAIDQGGVEAITWQQAEAALHIAYFYVEVLINAPGQSKVGINANTFVVLPSDAARMARKQLPQHVYADLPLNALGNLVQRVVTSNISSYPHPAVQLQFFECLNRYAPFFVTRPDKLGSALFAFLDSRGVYNPLTFARHRVWYLLSRFVKDVIHVLPLDYVDKVLSSLQDLLVVRAELPSVSADEDPLIKATEIPSSFDSQLYLFESVGNLISLFIRSPAPAQAVVLLKAVCDPLLAQLRGATEAWRQSNADLLQVLQVHHLMLALGNLAKGFPENSTLPPANDGSEGQSGWLQVFRSVTEQILVVSGELSQCLIIREASRGAFARIVATGGTVVLPMIPSFIQSLLPHLKSAELVDFLSFLGLVVAKYKDNVRDMLDELFLVLVERVFQFLGQDVTGTDDAVSRSELERGYIAFLSTLVAAGLDGVLCSPRNQEQLETLLQSIVYYAENGDTPSQRAAFGILGKLVSVWGQGTSNGVQGNGVPGQKTPGEVSGAHHPTSVPGFENFIYDTLIPLAFTVPASPQFDLNDAQSQLVLTDIAQLLKTIQAKRGHDEMAQWLMQVYFPRISCPQDLATDFVKGMQEMEAGKRFKAHFNAFILRSRGG